MEKAERNTCIDIISCAQAQNHNLTPHEQIIPTTAIQLKHTHIKLQKNKTKRKNSKRSNMRPWFLSHLISLAFSRNSSLYPSLAWLMKLHSPLCNCIMEVTEEAEQHGLSSVGLMAADCSRWGALCSGSGWATNAITHTHTHTHICLHQHQNEVILYTSIVFIIIMIINLQITL